MIGGVAGECVVQARYAQVRMSQSPQSSIKFAASDPVTLATITVAARQTAPSGWSSAYGPRPSLTIGSTTTEDHCQQNHSPKRCGGLGVSGEFHQHYQRLYGGCLKLERSPLGTAAGDCFIEARYAATATCSGFHILGCGKCG